MTARLQADSTIYGERGSRLFVIPERASAAERAVALEREASKLALLLQMSTSLASGKELHEVLNAVGRHTSSIMDCDRSSVLMLDKEKQELYSLFAHGLEVNELRFSAQTGIAGYAVQEGLLLNVPDAQQNERFNPAIDKQSGYRTVSMLVAPLLDHRNATFGVIQCINKKGRDGIVPFNHDDEVVLTAVAAQAASYLENSALVRQTDQLFEAFVEAMSRSIDDRDPCTSGHSRRVTLYSLALARAVHACEEKPFTHVSYTRERYRQLRYACLLHDVGKIGVREHILAKASRISSLNVALIRQRFETLKERRRSALLARCVAEKIQPEALLVSEYAPLCCDLDAALALIETVNAASFVQPADAAELKRMLAAQWIAPDEYEHLSVKRGNLTEKELIDMQSHVTKSWRMLSQIPWPAELKDLPEIAYAHHERLDGSGYPRNLKGEAIHLDGQIMGIADVYEALTASDRPYKPAIPHKRVEIIMREQAASGQLSAALIDLFFTKKCYKIDAQT